MKRLNQFCFLCGLFAVLLIGLSAFAQVDYSTATLKGTVLDPNGAVIAGATVTATSAAGITRTTKTGGDGSYRLAALPPGIYEITVQAQGFAKEVSKGVELTVGQNQVYDAHMKVGGASEVVEVSSDSIPLIQTEQTQQANTINKLQVDDLPNINHNITQAVYTLPGVANADAPRSQQPGFTGFGTTGFSIGGSNGRNNLSTIDGGENEYGTGQYRVTTIPQDTIQEYQVNRNGFAAEFGFTDGSAINIVTKSGGNQWHGGVYGQFQNHTTSAQNFFNGFEGLPSAYSQNIYTGFTIGGPIKKDKFFFFLGYEYRDLNNADYTNAGLLNAGTVVGPNAQQSAYVTALKNSGNPFLIGFANGITPGLSPLNNPALNKILTSENGVFNDPFRLQNTILRFDANPNDRNSLNLRVEYSHDNYGAGNPDGSALLTRDFSILTTWNHNFSPSVLNQVLVQIVPRNVANNVPNAPFQGVNFSLGNLNVGNLGGTSSFGSPTLVPYLAHQSRYQFEDNLTWNHGKHTFKFGASMRLADYHVEDDLWFNPDFDFLDGAIPLFDLAPTAGAGPCPGLPPTVLLSAVQCQLALFNLGHGLPLTGASNTNLSAPQSFAFGIPVDVRIGQNNPKWQGWGKYFGSYMQDSWKLSSRLTVNAGVRFDVDNEPPPLSQNFYASPRLGFAWDPFGDQKTVVRAGAGIYVAPVDVLIPSYAALLGGSGQYINEGIFALPGDQRAVALWQIGTALGNLPFGHVTAQDLALAGIVVTPAGSVQYSTAPNFKNPYTIQTSLSIQRQLGKSYSVELGYTMYHGVHLQMPVETGYTAIAPGNPACAAFAAQGLVNCTDATGGPLYVPNGSQIEHTTYASNGSSIYHAMTASLTKRYTHGLQFQVNYTWSKSIDDVVDFASFQEWFRPSRLDLFRAVSAFDIPHTLVANAVYTTPFKAGSGNALNTIFADISIAPIVTWRSGLPFSVRTPSLFNGLSPADNNFAMPFNSPRDANRGADYATTDLRLKKDFFINRDRGVKLETSIAATNIFNRVNFDKVSDVFDNGLPMAGTNTPFNELTGPYVGLHGVKPTPGSNLAQPLSYSAADLPRQVQFGLKLAF